uniref:Uncharacterized protein n=1 Tax=Sphaerodactylus townsendi TaxID=933632 RepID=A0ACB8FU53_9SAUR
MEILYPVDQSKDSIIEVGEVVGGRMVVVAIFKNLAKTSKPGVLLVILRFQGEVCENWVSLLDNMLLPILLLHGRQEKILGPALSSVAANLPQYLFLPRR